VGDGVLVATPAGSTGYNRSAHGAIIPLGANLLALTPLNAYAPRRWHGALLNDDVDITIDVLQPKCRPVYLTADDQKIDYVERVRIHLNRDHVYTLLFDHDHHLQERIIQEQFSF
jgi:NAD+ kinase